jgi:PadR family transcriptional regulator PadR
MLPSSKRNFEKQAMKHMLKTFLLWVISKGKVHGYELIKRLEVEGGMRTVSASQIYPLLKGMMGKGLISQEKEMHGKRARKLYHITAQGKSELKTAKLCMCASPLRRQFMLEMAS